MLVMIDSIKIISVILSIASIYFWYLWGRKRPNYIGFIIMPISYCVHVILFNLVVMLDAVFHYTLDPIMINAWSTGVRLHAMIFTLLLAIWHNEFDTKKGNGK